MLSVYHARANRPLIKSDGQVAAWLGRASRPNLPAPHTGLQRRQGLDQLDAEFTLRGVLHDLPTSVGVARWAYETTYAAGGLTWLRQKEMTPLTDDWHLFLL